MISNATECWNIILWICQITTQNWQNIYKSEGRLWSINKFRDMGNPYMVLQQTKHLSGQGQVTTHQTGADSRLETSSLQAVYCCKFNHWIPTWNMVTGNCWQKTFNSCLEYICQRLRYWFQQPTPTISSLRPEHKHQVAKNFWIV
jgi:hypothetical protein